MAQATLAVGGTQGGPGGYTPYNPNTPSAPSNYPNAGGHASPALPQSQPIAQFEEGTIVFTRPLHELWQHLTNYELPSWALIVRAISTLFMAIFRWHLCDGIMLMRAEGIFHSFDGVVEKISPTGREIDSTTNAIRPYFQDDDIPQLEQYPHLLRRALFLRCRVTTPETLNPAVHATRDLTLTHLGNTQIVAVPNFVGYQEISEKAVRSYFASAYHKDITDRAEGNTIWTLLHSDRLQEVTDETVENLYGRHQNDVNDLDDL